MKLRASNQAKLQWKLFWKWQILYFSSLSAGYKMVLLAPGMSLTSFSTFSCPPSPPVTEIGSHQCCVTGLAKSRLFKVSHQVDLQLENAENMPCFSW